MKNAAVFLLIFLAVKFAIAQSFPILTDQLVQPSKNQLNKHFIEYRLGRILVNNGEGKESKYFYIIDKSTGNKIYEYDQKDSKARRFVPKFFMTDDDDNLIILCMSLEGNYSWGVHVFIIDHGEVFHSGFINYGADNFNFSSLALYTQFEQNNDWFKMTFREDIKIINYATDDLIEGSSIEFKVEKDRITRIR